MNINLGLLALRKVIDALRSRSAYVPYSDSALTLCLSESLGGKNCVTALLVNFRSESAHATETVSALRFGSGARDVVGSVACTTSSVALSMLAEIDAEIETVRGEIRRLERWENRVDGEKTTQVITGAETQNEALESLLRRRMVLCGEEW